MITTAKKKKDKSDKSFLYEIQTFEKIIFRKSVLKSVETQGTGRFHL